MRRWLSGALAVVALLPSSGCSSSSSDDDDDGAVGSSGVPGTKYLDELTPAELRQLCEWSTPAQGGPGEKSCGDFTVTTKTVDDCTAEAGSIHCTVAMTEACVRSMHGNACALLSTQACSDYIACALGG